MRLSSAIRGRPAAVEPTWLVALRWLVSIAAGAVFLLVTSSATLGISPDSAGYLGAAHNLADGLGLTLGSGEPLVLQPPGFPAVLALFDAVFGIDPLIATRYLHALVLALVTYLGARMFARHLPEWPGVAAAATLVVPTSLAVWSAMGMVWSEPLFLLVVLLHLWVCEAYLERPSGGLWAGLVVTVAAACMIRYVGVLLFVTGGLAVLIAHWRSPLTWLTRGIGLGVLAGLSLALWLAHNVSVTGAMFGPRAESMFSFWDNFQQASQTVLRWYLPRAFESVLGALVLAGVGVGALAYWRRFGLGLPAWAPLRRLLPSLVFVLVYATFLVVTATTTAFDSLHDRLMLPIFVPLSLVLVVFAAFVTQAIAGTWLPSGLLQVGFALVLLLWTGYRATIVVDGVEKRNLRGGEGYASETWAGSAILGALRERPDLAADCRLYSNGEDAVYVLSGRSALPTPAWTLHNSNDVLWSAEKLVGTWPEHVPACVVWLDAVERRDLFGLDELRAVADFRLLERFSDGAIYAVAPR